MNVERVESFDTRIDECEGAIMICGITFNASDILAALDPIAYNCYAGDYLSEQEDDEDEDETL